MEVNQDRPSRLVLMCTCVRQRQTMIACRHLMAVNAFEGALGATAANGEIVIIRPEQVHHMYTAAYHSDRVSIERHVYGCIRLH